LAVTLIPFDPSEVNPGIAACAPRFVSALAAVIAPVPPAETGTEVSPPTVVPAAV
jgi:hypothetical protein